MKFPILWNFLRRSKDSWIKLSRVKDVLMMMILFHIWPEQTYRFSTRKLLPSKKNRFSKESRPVIPYDLLKFNSSNIPLMKEINIIGRGSSFDLNDIKKIKGPIFLIAFWNPLKISDNGNVTYNHCLAEDGSCESGKFAEHLKEYLSDQAKKKDYVKKNITYAIGIIEIMELLKKNSHNILNVKTTTTKGKDGNYCEPPSSDLHLIDNDQCKHILVEEKVYKHPMLDPHPKWAPTGSFLPYLCALSYFADKINVYGWDFYLKSSPENMNYWQLFFNMYKYGLDINRSKNHFESALINFYYGYQFSKLPNINFHGYLGQLDKHEKLIKRIERVLFN